MKSDEAGGDILGRLHMQLRAPLPGHPSRVALQLADILKEFFFASFEAQA